MYYELTQECNMQLKNPFSTKTRELYRDLWACMICGMNGTSTGGLELNHITGRDSSSAYNASLLCRLCHSHVGHSREEHIFLFHKNRKYLQKIGYVATEQDKEFIKKHFADEV